MPTPSAEEKECPHTTIGQKYDERRGTGNGSYYCFGCNKTIYELLTDARSDALEEVREIVKAEQQRETEWQETARKEMNPDKLEELTHQGYLLALDFVLARLDLLNEKK